MGLFDRLFGKKTDMPAAAPAPTAKERPPKEEPAKEKPAAPAEPKYTQEELYEKFRNEYAFAIHEGERYMPQIDDLKMLRELKNYARHPRAKYLAGERYKEVLAERRAKAETHVAGLSSQDEIVALAEDESADEVLRKVAAKAVTDQGVLKRWAIEHDKAPYLRMLKRISDPADLADIARDAKDERTRTAATKLIRDEAVLEDMARNAWGDRELAAKRLEGYVCSSCNEAVLPEDGEVVPCVCPGCGAANHVWQRVNNVREYRDYEVGEWHDECTRCGATANHHNVNTW